MEFHWKKKGRIFISERQFSWMQSYAQVPTVLKLKDRLRIYFTCRPEPESDGSFTSAISFIDVDKRDPKKVLYLHNQPVLSLGEPGTFDHFGSMPAYALRRGEEIWLYYVGWTRWTSVPYNHAIGLAISQDGGRTFKKYAKGPIIARASNDPFFQNSPCIFEDNDLLHMWYSSGIGWIGKEAIYTLKHATSSDGKCWTRTRRSCMPTILDDECQTCPIVLRFNDHYHMWFSYRYGVNFRTPERGYSIGYAWSDDLISWHREPSYLDVSEEGWDSEMVCYPFVIKVEDKIYMFYSGNYFGRSGFGYAVLEKR